MNDSRAAKQMKFPDPDYKIRILLIDDDLMVLEVLEEYLKSFGFTNIIPVNESKKALKLIQDPEEHYDLIMSDWEMPEINGLMLLQNIRKHEIKGNTRFIIVTSQQSMERFKISRAAHWQVNAYIVKPFRAHTLKEKIWKVMGWMAND